MKNLKNLFLAALVIGATALTGCLHIIEEVTFRNNGNGSYKMSFDMGELKGMMDMMKGMGGDQAAEPIDSTNMSDGGDYTAPAEAAPENPMAGLSEQFGGVTASLSGIPGISNIVEINDTAAFNFGYSFDFKDVAALNRALKIIGKEKYQTKNEETFKFNGKSFERLSTGDMGAELQKAMAENTGDEEEEGAGQADMMKMLFADMSYKQVYLFPDRKVKKSDNKLGEIGDDGHSLTVTLKPFDEEQKKQKASVATKVKLK